MRCGELVVIETTDYDKENKILHITKSESRSYQKTEDGTLKFVGVIVDEPKKEASKRDIPLTDEACRILDMIILANEENKQSAGNYIFVYNNHRIQTASVLKKIYKLCDEFWGLESFGIKFPRNKKSGKLDFSSFPEYNLLRKMGLE